MQGYHREFEIKFYDFSLIGVPLVKPVERYYRGPKRLQMIIPDFSKIVKIPDFSQQGIFPPIFLTCGDPHKGSSQRGL